MHPTFFPPFFPDAAPPVCPWVGGPGCVCVCVMVNQAVVAGQGGGKGKGRRGTAGLVLHLLVKAAGSRAGQLPAEDQGLHWPASSELDPR